MEPKVIGKRRQRPAEVGQLLDLIARSLDDDKAEDVVVIDLHGKSSIADYMVVANGRSSRQVSAIADHLLGRLKEAGHGRARKCAPFTTSRRCGR
jgi:ribosome-associated protein